MISRRDRVYSQYPEPVVGYELYGDKSAFGIIIPEATTNLVLNPSFEGGVTTGYSAQGGAIAAVATWQAFGSYGGQITPAVSTESGIYYQPISLTSGVTYTFSTVIQGEAGKLYYIWFSTNAGALIGAKKSFRGTGHKQRVFVTYNETSSASRQFHVTRDAQYTDQNVFYVDGFQVEAKDHMTTYCDGSLTGFVVGETPYLWTGVPHASTSTRSAQTRSGGREMNLLDLGIRVLAVIGLGMMPLVDQALPIPGYGELAQGTGTMAREFTLVSAIDAEAGSRQMSAILSTIYDAVKPDLTVKDQPLILRYQQLDEDGDPCGESLDILCKYRTGLEGQNDNNHSRRVAIGFKQYIPYIKSTYDNGTTLGFSYDVADADYIVMRDNTGLWQEMANGMDNSVFAMVRAPDGSVYVGGAFTSAGGVANTAKIARWTGSAWVEVGGGLNGNVLTLKVGANGYIYVGGEFTNAGGVAAADYIAYWDGANWNAIGSGAADNGVYDIEFDNNGNLYAVGAFTQMGGVANTHGLAVWNGATWASIGTLDAYATSAVINQNLLYIGGYFETIGGVSYIRLACRNLTTGTWSALGAGLTPGGPEWVSAMELGPDGMLYIGGEFTSVGNYIVKWNGFAFQPIGTGTNNEVRTISFDNSGNIWAGGDFTTAGGLALPDRMAIWNGSAWLRGEIDLPGAPAVYSILHTANGYVYIGFSTSGTAVSSQANTITNPGSSDTFMVFTFTGPGTVYQVKNYLTGKGIYFNLFLVAGETAVLTLNPNGPSFVSNLRGNIYNFAVMPGSNLGFDLMSGANNISAFIGDDTAATALTVKWCNQYNSLDAAVWK